MGDIMLGMMVPQFLLLLVSTVLVWAGVRQGLAPLVSLRAEIGQRTHHDLRPLETETLPEELRRAIMLREIDGLSYEEIAATMDCPIGTVRSRIFRAREAVAGRLRPLLDTAPDQRW